MSTTIKLNFCSLEIFKKNKIVIGTINEGVHLTPELSETIVLTVFKHLGDHPMVYITNRINSYSIDPTLYTNISKIKNIIGFGVVCNKTRKTEISEIEKLFYKNKFKLFETMDNAMFWAIKTLEHNAIRAQIS